MATSKELDWRTYLTTNPDILVGKMAVRGTRLSVEFILRLFAAGWTHEQVLESYPSLTDDSLRAIFTYAAELIASRRDKELL
jgi:uncharacterized protein (DUF433 family)